MMIRRFINWLAVFTSLMGVVVIIGWVFDVEVLTSLIPGFVTMKFMTAFSFVLSGLILGLVNRLQADDEGWVQVLLPSVCLLLLLIATTILVSVFLGFKTGLESLFVVERGHAVLATVPGRPSLGTLLAFHLVGLYGPLSLFSFMRLRLLLFVCGLLVLVLGSAALFGYWFGFPSLYYAQDGLSTAMAIHTAGLFVLLGVGFLLHSISLREV